MGIDHLRAEFLYLLVLRPLRSQFIESDLDFLLLNGYAKVRLRITFTIEFRSILLCSDYSCKDNHTETRDKTCEYHPINGMLLKIS